MEVSRTLIGMSRNFGSEQMTLRRLGVPSAKAAAALVALAVVADEPNPR